MSDRSDVAALLGMILGSALLLSGCGKPTVPEKEAVRPLRVMEIGSGADFSGRSFPGRAAAHREINLSFRVGGPLLTFPVKVGDQVAAGDILARLDPRDYDISILSVEGELERARAELTLAQRQYQRALDAEEKSPDLISESELDNRLGARDRSQGNVKALEATRQAARDALAYTTLTAPFDGTVVNTFVENFEDVRNKQPVLRLLDTARLEFTVNLPETLISLLPTLRDIEVVFDAFPDVTVPAEVDEVGSEASESTRTYPVTLIMDQPDGAEILPGMAGNARGSTQAPVDGGRAMVIPVTAVFSKAADGATSVWVVDQVTETVSQRQIQTGRLVAEGIEVLSGLGDGEQIAIAGVNFLREGQQIRPIFD